LPFFCVFALILRVCLFWFILILDDAVGSRAALGMVTTRTRSLAR
jgi:hypothetical protein